MGGGACFFGFKAAKSGILSDAALFEGDPAPRSTTGAEREEYADLVTQELQAKPVSFACPTTLGQRELGT